MNLYSTSRKVFALKIFHVLSSVYFGSLVDSILAACKGSWESR